jgi:hypothetical protein
MFSVVPARNKPAKISPISDCICPPQALAAPEVRIHLAPGTSRVKAHTMTDRGPSQTEVRKERTRKLAEKRGALASQILSPCQVCGKHQSLQGQTELGGTRLLRKQWCCRPHPYEDLSSRHSSRCCSSRRSTPGHFLPPSCSSSWARTSSARAAEQLPKRFRVPSREPYQGDRGMFPMAPAPNSPCDNALPGYSAMEEDLPWRVQSFC